MGNDMGNDTPEYCEPPLPGSTSTTTPIATLFEMWCKAMKITTESPEAGGFRPAFYAGAMSALGELCRRDEAVVMFKAASMTELRDANVNGMSATVEQLNAIGRRLHDVVGGQS